MEAEWAHRIATRTAFLRGPTPRCGPSRVSHGGPRRPKQSATQARTGAHRHVAFNERRTARAQVGNAEGRWRRNPRVDGSS